MTTKLNSKFAIFFIILIAIFLRLVLINQVPPSLNWDEASLGYNAYSILKTGKDEWGRVLPLTFEAFGDYKLPGYIYTLVPFVAIFGLNEFSVKLPSIIAGIFSIYILYLIVSKLTQNNNLALVSAFLFAITPWHIFLSRIALEANLALMFFLTAVYFFFKGLSNYKYFFVFSIFISLTIFTYNSARVFIPLFLIGLFFIYRRELLGFGKKILPAFVLLFIFFGLALYLGISQDSSSRYFWVKIIDEGAINYIEQSRAHSQLPDSIDFLVYNRYSYFITTSVSNYLKHFSPDFLFISGGTNYQFSIPKTGLLFLIELPFLILGILNFKKNKYLKVFILAILLGPIPASITRESPHVLRAIFMLGSLQVLTAQGLVIALETFKKVNISPKTVVPVVTVVYVMSLAFYMNKYLFIYPKQYSESWQYGYKQVINYLQKNNLSPDTKIYFSKKYGEPHIFYLFYTKYDPSIYQTNETLVRYQKSNWRWVDRLDNIYYIDEWRIKDELQGKKDILLITDSGNSPSGGGILYQENFLNNKGAFDVIKY